MKKIFIYDSRLYFSAFIKTKFGKDYNVIKLHEVELMNVEYFSLNNIGILVINDEKDIIYFLSFKKHFGNRVIICFEKNELYDKYNQSFKPKCVNILKPKSTIYVELVKIIETTFDT